MNLIHSVCINIYLGDSNRSIKLRTTVLENRAKRRALWQGGCHWMQSRKGTVKNATFRKRTQGTEGCSSWTGVGSRPVPNVGCLCSSLSLFCKFPKISWPTTIRGKELNFWFSADHGDPTLRSREKLLKLDKISPDTFCAWRGGQCKQFK